MKEPTKCQEIAPHFMPIAAQFKAILLDAYGVFWGGNSFGVLPGSKAAMRTLVSSGKVVGVLSNSTQLSSREIEKLAKSGIVENVHFHFLITSGDVARQLFTQDELPFETAKKKYWLFGGTHPKFSPHQAIFQDTAYSETTNIHEADFIYASVPHIHGEDQTCPSHFHEQVEYAIQSGLPMVCANPDHFAHEGVPPKAVVRQGSIAALYEKLGGYVFYIGKPFEIVYSKAMEQFSRRNILKASDVLMVGDTPETDIRGARFFGMASALVTATGIMADRISHYGFEQAIQKLAESEYPDYFIERMAIHEF